MKLRIVPFKRADASWNLALEEALFLKAKQDLLAGKEVQPVVKMYSFKSPSVVLGYMQKISEIDKRYCDERGINVTMRTTGGGSVFLGEQDLQYSLIMPSGYSKKVLRSINEDIVNAMQDNGFSAQMIEKTGHDVVRLDKRGVVFDAQRRFGKLMLHHGTTLVDNFDYKHMPKALKASPKELEILKNGNVWLRQVQQVKERDLIKAFEKNLPGNVSIVRKDYTNEEIALARELHKKFYTNAEAISEGKKDYGICYLTDSDYDMEKYVEKDKG